MSEWEEKKSVLNDGTKRHLIVTFKIPLRDGISDAEALDLPEEKPLIHPVLVRSRKHRPDLSEEERLRIFNRRQELFNEIVDADYYRTPPDKEKKAEASKLNHELLGRGEVYLTFLDPGGRSRPTHRRRYLTQEEYLVHKQSFIILDDEATH